MKWIVQRELVVVLVLGTTACSGTEPCSGSNCSPPGNPNISLSTDEAKLLELFNSPTGSIEDRTSVEWALRTGHYAGDVSYGVAPIPANLSRWTFQLGDVACLNLEERTRFNAHEDDLKSAIAAGAPFETSFEQQREVAACRPNLPGSYELSWSLDFDGQSFDEVASYRSAGLALSDGTALELIVQFSVAATVNDASSGAASSHSIMRFLGDCGPGDNVSPSPYDVAGIVDVTADGNVDVRKVVAVPTPSGRVVYALEQTSEDITQQQHTFRIRGADGTLTCRRQSDGINDVSCEDADGEPSYVWPRDSSPDVRAVEETCFRLPSGGQ